MSFYIRLLFHPWLQIHLCYPQLILPNSNTASVLAIIEVIPVATSAPTVIGIAAMTGLIFMVLIPLLPQTGTKVIGSSPDGLLLVGSGPLTPVL
jgi:hypothetical protein